MLTLDKTAVWNAENAEEIAISSKHISSLIHFIAGIYICPPRWREVIVGIYIIPSAPREITSCFSCGETPVQSMTICR